MSPRRNAIQWPESDRSVFFLKIFAIQVKAPNKAPTCGLSYHYMAQLPILPYGSPTLLSGLSETFSFHSSPESFITSRVLAFRSSNPSLAESRSPIRAKVLNRNVAVASSYKHVKQLLSDDDMTSKLSSSKAYDELMAPFFPPPNLLLTDPPEHQNMKEMWRGRIDGLASRRRAIIEKTIRLHFEAIESGSSIDLYHNMKSLSWKLILAIFISNPETLNDTPDGAAEIADLQEDLLRGQFSLFPVSINTRFWQSPRSKGLAARQRLQKLLKERVSRQDGACPFTTNNSMEGDDVASHMLLFTSSLAVKALASLLTAVMLNLYMCDVGKGEMASSLASKTRGVGKEEERDGLIRSMVLETERLSPPVVGIMRRTTSDVVLPGGGMGAPDTLIPRGWDVWLYFVGAARDPAIFKSTAQTFVPERYLKDEPASKGLAFGAGGKSCLGEDLMREVVMTVVKVLLGIDGQPAMVQSENTSMEVNVCDVPVGVQAWLGWQADVKPEDWARDMKQLPTQRPSKPVIVTIHRNLG